MLNSEGCDKYCYKDEITTHLIADLSNAAIFCYAKKDKSSPEVFTDLERPLEIMSDSSLSNKERYQNWYSIDVDVHTFQK